MTLINVQNGDVQPTVPQKQIAKRALITTQLNTSFQELILEYKTLFDEIWNASDLNPQEVMDAFGTDAGSLLTILDTLRNGVNAIVASTITVSVPAHTVNSDGSVVVN